jgi:hypothetical protein
VKGRRRGLFAYRTWLDFLLQCLVAAETTPPHSRKQGVCLIRER